MTEKNNSAQVNKIKPTSESLKPSQIPSSNFEILIPLCQNYWDKKQHALHLHKLQFRKSHFNF